MLFWILLGLAVALVVYSVSREIHINMQTQRPWNEDVVFVAFTLGMFAIFIPMMFYCLITTVFVTKSHQETHSLRALSVGSKVDGSFFLGIGSVDSKPVVYYYRHDGAGYKLDWEYTKNSTFVPSDKPHYSITCSTPYGLLFPWDFNDCSGDITFYVPENSITNKYKVGFPS